MGRVPVAIRESRVLLSIPGIENLPPAVKYLIAFAIIFMLLALFALVLRRLTGAKLTLSGDRGRARQPRLGIVDVYDLDRHRQLILLRRDNVEHLLLVGGPNDVVVETNIVRVPGARLPAATAEVAERLEAASAERPPEIAPVRPVVEPTPARPAARQQEPVVAGHLGRAETATAAATPLRPTAVRAEPPVRAVPAGPAASAQRTPDRSRATPVAAPAQSGGAAARPITPPVTPRPAPVPPPPTREPAALAGRPGLSDMARQLEDVLNRPEPTPAPPARPAPEPAREAAPTRPQPAPATRPEQLPPTRPVPEEAPQDESEAELDAAEVAEQPSAPVPPPPSRPTTGSLPASAPVQASAPAPEPPRAPEPPPPPPEPAATPAPRPDPFSIEDIEAEFARLLGRPLDRKDNKS